MNFDTARYWINKLHLKKHPEGGFYARSFKSNGKINQENLPFSFEGERHLATSIYYLLESHDISVFHRLHSDEVWYYHYGSPVVIHTISSNGDYKEIIVGPAKNTKFTMQAVIPAGTIFGAKITEPNTFGLFGCMVTPGFDFSDFEIVSNEAIERQFPGIEIKL